MAMTKREISDWLNTIDDDTLIGIDDGGLSLCIIDDQQVYCEVGGIPEEYLEHPKLNPPHGLCKVCGHFGEDCTGTPEPSDAAGE